MYASAMYVRAQPYVYTRSSMRVMRGNRPKATEMAPPPNPASARPMNKMYSPCVRPLPQLPASPTVTGCSSVWPSAFVTLRFTNSGMQTLPLWMAHESSIVREASAYTRLPTIRQNNPPSMASFTVRFTAHVLKRGLAMTWQPEYTIIKYPYNVVEPHSCRWRTQSDTHAA